MSHAINTVSDYRAAVRLGAYAWPGGHPLVAHMSDGGSLCCKCLKRERREILESFRDGRIRDQWRPVALDTHMEGAPIVCDNCGADIKSAYGD